MNNKIDKSLVKPMKSREIQKYIILIIGRYNYSRHYKDNQRIYQLLYANKFEKLDKNS